MDAVIKIGGSLVKNPKNLVKLCKALSRFAKVYKIVIIPGGGEFADSVRKYDKKYRLSNKISHKMAILAMDQYGLLLSNIIPKSHVTNSVKKIINSKNENLWIFLPSKYLFNNDPLENSWNVTSDTIAAHIAKIVQSEKLILTTDVDGIFSNDPKKDLGATLYKELSALKLLSWAKRTSVDKALPKVILQTDIICYVVNGNYFKRIKRILENRKTICTHITN